ncbi:PREDICTED: cysteine-rich receptor-like protein kinase 3 isoform X2 [Prunus mume]|uniref:Cysteine-rich receptor-like protein kinase 3 isoform X2 n=1 Tax=Prunus mume TaxID=102107 RepID=A0ABM0NAH6_PRUMU|nr:PREDICTED: cysteine-rich receptor-like protein kinase 3 isoform X2 [Prunus mume]
MSKNCVLLLLLPLFFLVKIAHSDPRATEAALMCTNETALMAERQTFIANFLATMDAVTPQIAVQRYAAVVNGTGNNTVYAFGECMKDLSKQDCDVCFAQCKTQILRCLPFQKATRGGRLFFDGCYLRYDDFNFFNQSLSAQDTSVCGATGFGGNQSVFKDNALRLVRNLSFVAPKNDGFSVGFVGQGNETVYGLAQCWEFVNGSACEECLADTVVRIGSCPPKAEGRVLNAGCYLRYSTQKFYSNNTSTDAARNGGHRGLAIILAVTSAVFAVVLSIFSVALFTRKKILKRRKEKKQLGPLLATVNKSQLNFSYEDLERATNYFHDSNKLGQGGSGSVYKGVLPDGKVVAIKRLFFNTRQWVDHFFNEVNLISGIHHKNLVKLLGCSITGPESLLVYEYVPNQSLHDYFTVKNNVDPLRWELRYKIILGTAEGLAYLHEESKVRIIHRDIKLSNILLDENFMPKIADFGLARLFPEDKTHISTAIAGTLGYMAPEYVVRGKLTEKADVYSFGVLVIEVVCGKRNNCYIPNSVSILHMAWDLYGTGRLCSVVDPLLEGKFDEEEASRLLQIGLLCVQASAELRPAMSLVVKMLIENPKIPQPTQPPFLNSGSAEFGRQIPSGTFNTLPDSNNTHSSRNSMTQSWIEPR